jgi:hypothetical protein
LADDFSQEELETGCVGCGQTGVDVGVAGDGSTWLAGGNVKIVDGNELFRVGGVAECGRDVEGGCDVRRGIDWVIGVDSEC